LKNEVGGKQLGKGLGGKQLGKVTKLGESRWGKIASQKGEGSGIRLQCCQARPWPPGQEVKRGDSDIGPQVKDVRAFAERQRRRVAFAHKDLAVELPRILRGMHCQGGIS